MSSRSNNERVPPDRRRISDRQRDKTLAVNAATIFCDGPSSDFSGGLFGSTPDVLSGKFGRYQILRRLGRGGMGSVYLARDSRLDREVALKVPHFEAEDEMRSLDRFKREASIAATISHPNVCKIFDVGEIDGTHFLSMEYVEGAPLSDLVDADNPLPEFEAVALVWRLATALEKFHEVGVIHRDLKPANILIDREQEPIITDFGLARLVDQPDNRLTRTGLVVGTPAYMAPEQVSGESSEVFATADIYSLGVILYELLTGRLPFDGSMAEVFYQIAMADPLPPSHFRPDLSPGVERICRTAMAKIPVDRFASMNDMARALAGFLSESNEEIRISGSDSDATSSTPGGSEPPTTELEPPKPSMADHGLQAQRVRAKAASLLIQQRRDRLVETAKHQIKRGLPSQAAGTLESALQICPDDEEIYALLRQCRATSDSVASSLRLRVPRLEKDKRYCELSRCLYELKRSGVAIKGLSASLRTVRDKLRSVRPQVEFARERLKKHYYHEALEAANRIFDVVADHDEARRIAQKARNALSLLDETTSRVSTAIAHQRWFFAKSLLREMESANVREKSLDDLTATVDFGVAKTNNFSRLLIWTLAGAFLWVFAGRLASLLGSGVRVSLPATLFGVSAFSQVVIDQTLMLAGQMVLGIIALVVLKALLLRRLIFDGTLVLAAFAAVAMALAMAAHALIAGLLPASLTSLRLWQVAAELGPMLYYGALTGLLICALAAGLIEPRTRMPVFRVMAAGALASLAGYVALRAAAPLWNEMIPTIVFCALLAATGRSKRGASFLLVGLSGVVAGALTIGARQGDIGWFKSVAPLATATVLAGSAVLAVASRPSWKQVAVCGLLAVFSVGVCSVAVDVATAPKPQILLCVWFAACGTLVASSRNSLHFDLQLSDRLEKPEPEQHSNVPRVSARITATPSPIRQ